MAKLADALVYLFGDEGRYGNIPGDPGGETYRGIARNRWPDWPGWPMIDQTKAEPDGISRLKHQEIPELTQFVEQFYRLRFWSFDAVSDQQVANKMFDLRVNVGMNEGVTLVQRAVDFITAGPIVADGVWGPRTEGAVNAADPQRMMHMLRWQQCLYYASLVLHNPARAEFLDDWMRRGTA